MNGMKDYPSLARYNMIQGQLRPNQIADVRLLEAMGSVPRELFLPANERGAAYRDGAIPLGWDRVLMEPLVFARLVQSAEIKETDVVLDIGCATGYSTAVLAALAATVIGIEEEESFIDHAIKTINGLTIENTLLYRQETTHGYAEQGPYDVIIYEGMISEVSETIWEQLADQGRLIAVVADQGVGAARLYRKIGGKKSVIPLFTTTLPFLKGFTPSFGFDFFKGTLSLAILLLSLGFGSLGWANLNQTLKQAYTTNPLLESARLELQVIEEQLFQARGERLPRLEVTGSAGIAWSRMERPGVSDSDFDVSNRQFSVGIQLSQPIYQGGRITARIAQATNRLALQRQRLRLTEQSVLRQTAVAYVDLRRDQELANLTRNNETVLKRQLKATQDRFAVGEITRTDVSLARASVARATAERIQAQGQLTISQATFRQIVGQEPEDVLENPMLNLSLPQTLDQARDIALNNNPSLIAAQLNLVIAENQLMIARSGLLPTATLNGGVSQRNDTRQNTETTEFSVNAQLVIPLYTGGVATAQIREARHTIGQRQSERDQTLRELQASIVQAWQSLITAQAVIDATQARIQSSQIALEGVREEERVGSRTILDVLDSEQDLLDAQVSLVTAQRDAVAATFMILDTLGILTPETLFLDDL